MCRSKPGRYIAPDRSLSSGQIIIFHQARFHWNKGISLTKPPFGVRSCEVAIIWPDIMLGGFRYPPSVPANVMPALGYGDSDKITSRFARWTSWTLDFQGCYSLFEIRIDLVCRNFSPLFVRVLKCCIFCGASHLHGLKVRQSPAMCSLDSRWFQASSCPEPTQATKGADTGGTRFFFWCVAVDV